MTDWLKIVKVYARNVHRVHEHKCVDNDAFFASLSLQENDVVACSVRWGVVLLKVETLKNRLRTTCAYLAVVSNQESCLDSMPSSL